MLQVAVCAHKGYIWHLLCPRLGGLGAEGQQTVTDHLLVGVRGIVGVVAELTFCVVEGDFPAAGEGLGELEDGNAAREAGQEDGENLVELRLASGVHQVNGVGQEVFVVSSRFRDEAAEVALKLGK